LCEFVNPAYLENPSVGNQIILELNFIASQVSISDKLLSWLVDLEVGRKLLPSQVDRERVSAIVRVMNFPDFHGIISQEVMPNELEIVGLNKESQDFSIIV
jgi:hypothetical protein